jgi:hypothetical protein
MKMTHRLTPFLLLLAIITPSFEASAGPGQKGGFSVKTIKRSDWQFPVLEGTNVSTAERINALMFQNVFDLEFPAVPPANPEHSLTVLDDELPRSIASIGFQVLQNDDRLFSVLFDGEGCGAYCESFQRPLAFDRATGRLLTDADLFTEAGRDALILELVKRNQKAIQDQIAKIQGKNTSEFGSPEDKEVAIDMYQSCLGNWQSKEWRNWIGNMEFHPRELLFVHGRCSNHVLQGLDDLGDLRNSYAYAALKPWLSDYGRRLLLSEKNEGKPASALGQWLKGTIGGKTRISLYLTKPYQGYVDKESEIHGYYFYDRYRKPLKLQGKRKDGKFFLGEFDGKEIAQAAMILQNDGNGGLYGQWKSRGGKKVLEIKLDP